ncbi:MAG: chorismate synthase [Lachnospiraceae bacterium]
MAGSTLGNLFRISTWGETHGRGVGVVVDGCPAGLELCEEDIQVFLDRRKPGQSKFTTQRKETDQVEILSGVFEGKTTGTPISMVVFNKDQRSRDYSAIKDCFRPGHADYTFYEKYGFRDYRGGGRSSGRETTARVAAGAIASKILAELGITVNAYTKSIGTVEIDHSRFDLSEMNNNSFYMPDKEAAKQAENYVQEKMRQQDSVGGVIECRTEGLMVGLGEPVFEKISANLAKAVCSIGAVKGFEIGDGFDVAKAVGSQNNDNFVSENGKIKKLTNHSGGTLGGMTDGDTLIFRAAFKPTPSISQTQKTVNTDKENIEIAIKGRHDPIIVPRAVVVVEAMAAITIVDMLFMNMTAKMDKIKQFYKK